MPIIKPEITIFNKVTLTTAEKTAANKASQIKRAVIKFSGKQKAVLGKS